MLKFFNIENLKKLSSLRRRYTLGELYGAVREKLASPYRNYEEHYREYFPAEEELVRQRNQPLALQPLVSIIVPAYETPEVFLRQMVDSVLAQTYANWELLVADGSDDGQVGKVIGEYCARDARVRYVRLPENAGISENTNQGAARAKGEYFAFLDHDDLLVPSALYEMVAAATETGAELLYSDEDKAAGDPVHYMDPYFKLDFNSEMLLGNNYICHFTMVTKGLYARVGGMDRRFDGAQDFDFVLRCSEQAGQIVHVAKILYHWRIHEGSTAGGKENKRYAYEAGKHAVEAALRRRGQAGHVIMLRDNGFFQIEYPVPENAVLEIQEWGRPSSVWEKQRSRLESELAAAEVSVSWREIAQPEEYFHKESRLPESSRAFVLRINRNVKRWEGKSILWMLGSCARPGVKAVSAKTLVHNKICNCGYFRKESVFVPRFCGLPAYFRGYFRQAVLSAEVDAVGNDLTLYCCGRTEGRILVEPKAVIELKKH